MFSRNRKIGKTVITARAAVVSRPCVALSAGPGRCKAGARCVIMTLRSREIKTRTGNARDDGDELQTATAARCSGPSNGFFSRDRSLGAQIYRRTVIYSDKRFRRDARFTDILRRQPRRLPLPGIVRV